MTCAGFPADGFIRAIAVSQNGDAARRPRNTQPKPLTGTPHAPGETSTKTAQANLHHRRPHHRRPHHRRMHSTRFRQKTIRAHPSAADSESISSGLSASTSLPLCKRSTFARASLSADYGRDVFKEAADATQRSQLAQRLPAILRLPRTLPRLPDARVPRLHVTSIAQHPALPRRPPRPLPELLAPLLLAKTRQHRAQLDAVWLA